ncbi:phage N-6-adenine-methyltransferase [Serratia fonticola]
MKPLRYGSVCSGIEAATLAWHQLGWQPAWFSEIESFPSAVLKFRWPAVANLGDMTKIAAAVRAGEVEAPDLLVGGTPCQAFSIAGLRNGLSDARGQLTLSYVELADAIDDKRRQLGEKPAISVWENVPGVLNSKDNAFGCLLAALAGEDEPLQPSEGKWTNAGYVSGPKRTIAWIVKDAQYFGVAQRRRRVFVVASAREGFDPAAVLFELDSVRRDSAPSREAGAQVAALTANGVGTCGADDNQATAGHLITQQAIGEISPTLRSGNAKDNSNPVTHAEMLVLAYGGGNCSGEIDVGTCLTAKAQRLDFDVETFAVHSFNWQAGGNTSATLGTNEHITSTLQASQHPAVCVTGDITHTLKGEGFDGSEDGTGRGQPIVAFSSKDHGADASIDIAPALRAGNSDKSHANGGQPPAIAYAFAENSRGELRLQGGTGDFCGTLSTGGGKPGQGTPCIVEPYTLAIRGRGDSSSFEYRQDGTANALLTPNGGRAGINVGAVAHGMAVRRLMPVECERLQGMPDNHTRIPVKFYAKRRITSLRPADMWEETEGGWNLMAADGPRYKAIGNSMAVTCMLWLGQRIQQACNSIPDTEPQLIEVCPMTVDVEQTEEIDAAPAVSAYCEKLNDMKARKAHELKEVGDQWCTPDPLFWGINAMFGPLVLDLFSDGENSKCPAFYTAEDNALTQDWSEKLADLHGAAFGNPPYSRAQQHEGQHITGMVHIMAHAMAMRELGGRYVFLIKAATSETWWPEDADHIAFIRGRVGFDVPKWFVPADEKQVPSGAFFAGAVAIFDKTWRGPAMSYISREQLEAQGRAFLEQISWLAGRGVAA